MGQSSTLPIGAGIATSSEGRGGETVRQENVNEYSLYLFPVDMRHSFQ